jgi:hypothetical protein
MIEKIRLWWKFEGRYYHTDFIYGVKNLWNWFSIIWKDRDWDYDFTYNLLKFKLEKQAVYIYHHGVHNDAKRDAEKMFLCARLIEIQQEDLYAYEHLEYLDQSHEFVPTDETEQFYTVETTITRDDLTDYLNKYSRQYRLIDKTDKDDHEIAREIAHNNQKRSRKLLFKILEQNIERWWD